MKWYAVSKNDPDGPFVQAFGQALSEFLMRKLHTNDLPLYWLKNAFFFFFTNEMPNMDTNMLFFIPVLQTSNFEWSMNMGLISPLPKPYASCTQFILQILTELKLNKLHFSSSSLLLLKYHLITEENGDSWCLNHITSYEFKCLTTNILSRFLVLNNFPCVFDSVN